MTREILISADAISRYYGPHCAVNQVSFTVERGEVLGFLGPNGAGKSTTMQILSGVLAPSAGSISIAGLDIMDHPRAAKTQLGFLPEQPPLYNDLTIDEYLLYAARLRGVAKTRIKAALDNCKERCGLTKAGRRLIGNLSRGFQQRAGIAQAIIHAPSVIILDEPTSGLDPIQIREIRELIIELGRDHSVILSTHILPEVQMICGRVLIIHEGRLVLDRQLDRLNVNRGTDSIRVAFRQPPAVEILSAIHGIRRVEQINPQRFLIGLMPESAAIETMTRQSLDGGWGLFELYPENDSLEETFVRLTSGAREAPAGNTVATA